jgi:hypothetical protein
VHDSEPVTFADLAQASLPLAYEPSLAQRGHPASDSKRHVAGEARRERCAAAMGIASPRPARATGAAAATTPARPAPKLQVELPRSPLRHEGIVTSPCVGCGHTRTT